MKSNGWSDATDRGSTACLKNPHLASDADLHVHPTAKMDAANQKRPHTRRSNLSAASDSSSSQYRTTFLEKAKVLGITSDNAPLLSLVFAMLGCTRDRARQRELATECRKYLAKHVVERGEKSIELLQGLLILVHWYVHFCNLNPAAYCMSRVHYQFEYISNQRALYLHMAMSMVVDLELNKSPFARTSLKRFTLVTDASKGYEIQPDGGKEHTWEEKRTFLACLYLTSV